MDSVKLSVSLFLLKLCLITLFDVVFVPPSKMFFFCFFVKHFDKINK